MPPGPPPPAPETARSQRRHEPGASGAGGLIGGVLLGVFIGHKLVVAFTLGTVGWIAGMLKDRSHL